MNSIPAGVIVGVLVTVLTGALGVVARYLWVAARSLWNHRHSIWAALRWLVPVRDVGLYLSWRKDSWNIEVPFRSVNDVKWRLRAYRLTEADEITSMEADEHTDAFRLRIAAYDQSFADDVIDITEDLKKHRISIYVVGDVSGPHSTPETEALFS